MFKRILAVTKRLFNPVANFGSRWRRRSRRGCSGAVLRGGDPGGRGGRAVLRASVQVRRRAGTGMINRVAGVRDAHPLQRVEALQDQMRGD